jgi:hypothetical protein
MITTRIKYLALGQGFGWLYARSLTSSDGHWQVLVMLVMFSGRELGRSTV